MYDSIIIGGGPAGLAAAVYMARQKLNFILLTGDVGGKTLWSADVENYLGFHLLDGSSLVKKFQEHLADYVHDFELHESELVTNIKNCGKKDCAYIVQTEKAEYQTRTILIATGEKNRVLNIPGEKELFGHGVTYCAACDAPLYVGKNVHVIGGGNSAMDAALLLEKYAAHITIVSINSELTGDAVMKKRVMTSSKMTIQLQTKTTRCIGTTHIEQIGLQKSDGVEILEPTQGVFIEIGLEPITDFIDIIAKDKWGQIIIDKRNATSLQGIWAAGDVTDITEKQISVAVGEGSKAGLEIIQYLQKTEFSE